MELGNQVSWKGCMEGVGQRGDMGFEGNEQSIVRRRRTHWGHSVWVFEMFQRFLSPATRILQVSVQINVKHYYAVGIVKGFQQGLAFFEAEGQANCPLLGLQALLMPGIEEMLSSFREAGFQAFQLNSLSLVKRVGKIKPKRLWEVNP